MKKLTRAAVLAVAGLAPFAVVHADANYMAGDLAIVDSGDVNPIGIGLRFGRHVNANFAVELRGGIGIVDDDTGGVDLGLKHYAGLFAKGLIPVSDLFAAYGVIGYSTVKAEASFLGTTVTDSDSGVSFGIGGMYHVGAMSSVHFEYVQLVEDIDAFKVGMTWNFGG